MNKKLDLKARGNVRKGKKVVGSPHPPKHNTLAPVKPQRQFKSSKQLTAHNKEEQETRAAAPIPNSTKGSTKGETKKFAIPKCK